MVRLNIDVGELDDEPEALYALAHVANVACGGHAGDAASMARAVEYCARYGTRLAAHPSYVDRASFGRRAVEVTTSVLAAQVTAQCRALAEAAARVGLRIEWVKPHGALYHAAGRETAIARAVVDGAVAALGGGLTIVGPAGGALAEAARAAGLGYAREGFADRGVRSDGTLIPRDQPGALITVVEAARANAVRLARSGAVETVCVHGDTPGAVEIARAVREALDTLNVDGAGPAS